MFYYINIKLNCQVLSSFCQVFVLVLSSNLSAPFSFLGSMSYPHNDKYILTNDK